MVMPQDRSETDDKLKTKPDSFIGRGAHITGQVFFSGDLYVEGTVHGNVSALPGQPSTLVVGERARIDGEVRVARLVVAGTVNCQVTSSDTIELHAGARVTADVYYRHLDVRRGSILEGRLIHRSAD